jgi:uncharacterized membrane-anchored protein
MAEESLEVAQQSSELAEATTADVSQRLASEEIVVSAPFSFHGSAARIWKITKASDEAVYQVVLYTLAIIAIAIAWVLILIWYVIFGLLLVPYRLLRRGSRKKKLDDARQKELLAALEKRS